MPGTRMAFAGVRDEKDIANLWAYLKQFDEKRRQEVSGLTLRADTAAEPGLLRASVDFAGKESDAMIKDLVVNLGGGGTPRRRRRLCDLDGQGLRRARRRRRLRL